MVFFSWLELMTKKHGTTSAALRIHKSAKKGRDGLFWRLRFTKGQGLTATELVGRTVEQ